MQPITYVSDQPDDYGKALDQCGTLDELRAVTAAYAPVAADAKAKAEQMDDAAFKRFQAGLKKERAGKFAGEPFAVEFGCILMPKVMFKVSMVAQQFGAPWGAAYMRLEQTGQLAKLAA